MSLDAPSSHNIDGSDYRFAIVAARFNETFVDSLIEHAVATLQEAGADAPLVERVPGSAELPFGASMIAADGGYDAIIVLGVVIAGSTDHHKVIGDSTAIALQNLSIETSTPIINGILVVESHEQAEARSGSEINRGKEFADAALEMAAYTEKWKTKKNP